MRREHLESAAATYSHLRGLCAVPGGILMILAGLTNLDRIPARHLWIAWVAALAAVVGYLLIARHYRRTYGQVTLATRSQLKTGLTVLLGVVLVIGGLQLDWSADPPVNGTVTGFALLLLASYALSVGLRTHQKIIGGSLLVTGLLPVWGTVSPDVKINGGLVLVGAAVIVLGIFDNGVLKQTFGPADGLKAGDVGA